MFKRGFKAWCEETSLRLRREVGVSASGPLDPFRLAEHLGVVLKTPLDFARLAADTRGRLLAEHADCWSAFTVTEGPVPMVVYNPAHSAARTASDLMHELSHVILGHTPSKMFLSAGVRGTVLRSYDGDQESEAAWLAGCLLLPRPVLLSIGRERMPRGDACARFGVSRDLLTYRLNVSGVNLQLRRGRVR